MRSNRHNLKSFLDADEEDAYREDESDCMDSCESKDMRNCYPVYDPTESFSVMGLGRGLSAQLVWVVPDMARHFLENLHPRQRIKKANHLDSICYDMENSIFALTGEPMIFDSDGHFVDGQHRATGIIKTGKPQLILIIRGVHPDAYNAMGNNAKRKNADALRSRNIPNPTIVAAAVVTLNRYKHKAISRMDGPTKYIVVSPVVCSDLVDRHPGIVESVRQTGRVYAALRCAWGAVAFCHYIFDIIDKDAASSFVEKMATGEDLSRGNPILSLRRRFLSIEKFSNDDTIFMIMKTWNLWRCGRKAEVIKIGDNEKMPVPI